MPGDHHLLAVAERVDVDLDRVREEPVDQHRVLGRDGHRLAHVGLELVRVVDDLHRAPAQHVGRPHQHRVADPLGELARGRDASRGAVLGLAQTQLGEQRRESLAILGAIDRVGRGADDRHARARQRHGQAQRRLTAELHDHALRLLDLDDRQHVLERERLEVEPIARVVVGGDGLRIAVHHDGLVAVLGQTHQSVHAAVVELDALPDPVRPAAEDDDLRIRSKVGLRTPGRRSSTCTACSPRTPRRRCRRACRPARCPRACAARGSRPRWYPREPRACRSENPARFARNRSRVAGSAKRASSTNDLAHVPEEPRIDRGRLRSPTRACARAGTPRRPPRAGPGRARGAFPRAPRRRRRPARSRSGRSRASGCPSAATRGTCARSPSPRRPTSSARRAVGPPAGTSRR